MIESYDVEQFKNREYREAYADEFLNTYVASQIRTIREQRGFTQEELAALIGTKQTGVSRIESVNYSGWSVTTLKKIAFALGCRLQISLETFGSLLEGNASFSREALQRQDFSDDPAFRSKPATRDRGTSVGSTRRILDVSEPPSSDQQRPPSLREVSMKLAAQQITAENGRDLPLDQVVKRQFHHSVAA